jgi:pimeloyl-ACP methyl ester carboxylesterase
MVDTTPFRELYPFESHWLELDGIRYHYLDEGPHDGPTVVMLHGNPTWSFYYRNLINALKPDFRVVVPDHIGCGLSDKPQNYAYNLARHVENVESLLGHLNIQTFSLVVHDWGGVIGMGYAVQHPAQINNFVIFNTAAFVLKKLPFQILMCRPHLFGSFLVRGLNAFSGLATSLAVTRRMPPDVRRGYLAPYNNWHNRIAIHRFVQDIPWEDDHPSRPFLAEIDRGIAQFKEHPMLVIWGAKDFVFTEKEFFQEWRRRFPSAETHLLPDAGHYVLEDAHEQVIPEVKSFLREFYVN